jgi:copper transport protein
MPVSRARPGPRRLLVVAGLVALLHALILLVGASPASAHASLIGTDPAEGEVLAKTPDVVTFTFDERVSLSDQSIRVFDAQGEPVSAEATSEDTVVSADLPDELDDGTYVVTYRVVSADGHPIAGSLTFSIGAPSESVVPPDFDADPPRSMRVALKTVQALGYVGLLLAAGLVIFRCWLLGGARVSTGARDVLTRVHWGAMGLAVLAWAATVPLDGAYQQGLGLRGAVGADAVDLSLVGDDLVVLGLITVGLVLGLLAPRARDFATLGAAVAIAAPSVIGHTRAYEPVSLLIVTDVLHLAAGATWLGGLVGLGLTLPSLAGRSRDVAEVLARFSGVAAVVLGLLVVSGSLLGWRIIGSWSGLFGTTYGRLLMVKVGIVALVAGVAWWNRVRLLPRARDAVGHDELRRAADGVRRAVRVEALLIVAVLGVTGFLTNQSPRDEPESAVPAADRVDSAPIGDYQVLITLDPGTRGPNTLAVQIQDQAGEPLDLFAAPAVSVSNDSVDLGSLVLSPVGAGTYTAPVVFPASGAWEAQVSLRETEFDNPVAIVDLDVG